MSRVLRYLILSYRWRYKRTSQIDRSWLVFCYSIIKNFYQLITARIDPIRSIRVQYVKSRTSWQIQIKMNLDRKFLRRAPYGNSRRQLCNNLLPQTGSLQSELELDPYKQFVRSPTTWIDETKRVPQISRLILILESGHVVNWKWSSIFSNPDYWHCQKKIRHSLRKTKIDVYTDDHGFHAERTEFVLFVLPSPSQIEIFVEMRSNMISTSTRVSLQRAPIFQKTSLNLLDSKDLWKLSDVTW